MEETKEKIAAALIRLLESKSYGKISIRDICNETPISRNAFYYHFDSKEALIQWIINQQFLKYSLPFFKIKADNIASKSFFNYILDHKNFYEQIYHVQNGQFLFDCLSHAYSIALEKEYVKEYANVKKKDKERIDPRICMRYSNAGTAAVVVFWIGDGMQIPIERIAGDLCLMLTKSLEDVRDLHLY